MNIDIPVAIAKALLYPGLVSLLAVALALFLLGERLASLVSRRRGGAAAWPDVLCWAMSWERTRGTGEKTVSFLSLLLFTVIISSLPTYSAVSLVAEDINYALLVFLFSAYPLARSLAPPRAPLVLFYGLLLQLSMLGPGLVGEGWGLSRVSGRRILELPLSFFAAVFCLATLYLLLRASEGRRAFYRFLDLMFLLAGAAMLEVAFLGLAPGLPGFLGLAACFLLPRVGAELIVRYRLTRRPLFYARLTGFAIVLGLLLRGVLA